jgi:hypothetical protein
MSRMAWEEQGAAGAAAATVGHRPHGAAIMTSQPRALVPSPCIKRDSCTCSPIFAAVRSFTVLRTSDPCGSNRVATVWYCSGLEGTAGRAHICKLGASAEAPGGHEPGASPAVRCAPSTTSHLQRCTCTTLAAGAVGTSRGSLCGKVTDRRRQRCRRQRGCDASAAARLLLHPLHSLFPCRARPLTWAEGRQQPAHRPAPASCKPRRAPAHGWAAARASHPPTQPCQIQWAAQERR